MALIDDFRAAPMPIADASPSLKKTPKASDSEGASPTPAVTPAVVQPAPSAALGLGPAEPSAGPAEPPHAEPGARTPSAPSAPACQTGLIVLSAPLLTELYIDPQYAQTMTNAGLADQLTPDPVTTNRFTVTGSITNATNGPLHLANPPSAVLVGAPEARASGDASTDLALAPGETVTWTAHGQATFKQAAVTGAAADTRYLGPQWDEPHSGCAAPTVQLQ